MVRERGGGRGGRGWCEGRGLRHNRTILSHESCPRKKSYGLWGDGEGKGGRRERLQPTASNHPLSFYLLKEGGEVRTHLPPYI